ncbi:MAG: hypothetical protein EOP38_12945 [Rubrivivax sp.]|nr:MAG: hypothetical protein EOP38_12945 [Rubrivivax sp.]
MNAIQLGELPSAALLRRYQAQGAFTDCYFIDVPGAIGHARYVEAFYTTALFKLERWLLSWLVSRPSSDQQAHALAKGSGDRFAAWHVEARSPDQLLMCDFMGRTRSWLMIAPADRPGPAHTRLYFGSAVVPQKAGAIGEQSLGFLFRALMGFHRLYSRALLRSAVSSLMRRGDH